MLLQNKTIFIVEDNVLNRVTYQISLIREGAHVEFERSGPDAVARLRGLRQVDLIILDLMLTRGENGYHLFQQIRDNPKYAAIPIIAVSAAEPTAAMARCHEIGFDGYIAKPINERLFPEQLARVLAGEPIWSVYH
jgi:CheY-like chemotaxis protein